MIQLLASARTAAALRLGCEARTSSAAFAQSTLRSLFSTSTSSSSSTPPTTKPTEAELEQVLREALPGSTHVVVTDTSGGCGTMYEISVSAKEFAGLTKVKQHRLVADALPVKDWHGFVLHTTEAK